MAPTGKAPIGTSSSHIFSKRKEKMCPATFSRWWKVHGTVSKGIIFLLLRDLFHEDLPDFFLRTSASKEEISGYNHKTKTQRPK